MESYLATAIDLVQSPMHKQTQRQTQRVSSKHTGSFILVVQLAADPRPVGRTRMNGLLDLRMVEIHGSVLLQAWVEHDRRIEPDNIDR
jgi:hypothetical protein